ncbi:hypothetical protein D9M70_534320 [compost metagenome]
MNGLYVGRKCAWRSRNTRDTCLDHGSLGRDLVAHEADGFGFRADEYAAGQLDRRSKLGIFGKESVAGMDCTRPGEFSSLENPLDIQIALRGACRPNAEALIRQGNMA